MVPEGDGWALPCVVADEYCWWRSAERVDQALRRALDHHLLSLRCLSSVDNPTERLANRVYVVEEPDSLFCPEGGVYVDAVHFLDEEEIRSDDARDGYLSHWTCFEPMDRLVQAWDLARPLDHLLEGTLRYHINTERGPDPEEQRDSVSGSLRAALRLLEQTSPVPGASP